MATLFGTRPRRKQRRRSIILSILNAGLGLLVFGLVVALGAVFFAISSFYAEGPLTEDQIVVVEPGTSLAGIAQKLDIEGVIENEYLFRFGAMAMRKQADIKAGEFEIAARSSMGEVLEELTEGRPILRQVTVPEGFTSWQVVERLRGEELLTGEIDAVPAEGVLLPNSYAFQRGDTRQSVLDAMSAAFDEALAEIWEGRAADLPIETPQELVVLASIVEKETAVPEERERVAAVFVNRLRRGMRLQSDPTTIYGITEGKGPLGRGLLRSELEAETAYNTYIITGLPPGPIANPGIAALRAAANPADTEDLYFVADGSGGHAFAETYAEHRRNVAEWRRIEAEQAEAAALEAREDLEEAEARAIGDETGDAPAE